MKKLLYTLAAVLVCTGAAAQNPRCISWRGAPAFADEPRAGSATGLFQYSGTGRSGRDGGRKHVARPPALPPRRQAGDAAQSVGLVGRRPFGSPFEKSGQRRHSGQSARFRRLYRQPQALLVVRPQSAHERFDAVPLRAVPLLQDGRERAGTQSGPQFGCLCGSRVQLLVPLSARSSMSVRA